MARTRKKKAPPAWRRRFLRVLGQTGNVALAALQAGVSKGTAYDHRKRDPAFAARWDADQAKGKAAAAAGKKTRPRKASVELVLRDGKAGPKYVRAAEDRWCAAVEDSFCASLERTGCTRWAAAEAGVSTSTIYYRRTHYPDFAARCAAAEARAMERIPAILAAAAIASFDPDIEATDLPKVNIDQAIAIARLKGPGAAGGRAPAALRYGPPAPTIEEVRESILRRLDEIEAHEKEQGGDG